DRDDHAVPRHGPERGPRGRAHRARGRGGRHGAVVGRRGHRGGGLPGRPDHRRQDRGRRPGGGTDVSGAAVERVVAEYLSHLGEERGLAENALASYRRDLRRYVEFLLGRDITDPDAITEADVVAFAVALRTGDEDHAPLDTSSVARTVVAV